MSDGILSRDDFDYWVRAGGHVDDAEEALREHDRLQRARITELETALARVRFVVEYWRDAMLRLPVSERWAAHGLACALVAVDGETDPVEMGLDATAAERLCAVLSAVPGDEK